MSDWAKLVSVVLAMTSILLTGLLLVRFELKAEIETVKAELLGEVRLIRSHIEAIQLTLDRITQHWVQTEVRSRLNEKRIERLEK